MDLWRHCEHCGELLFGSQQHRCANFLWKVWCPEDGETADCGRECHAMDAESAAEAWAVDRDADGESSDDPHHVHVLSPDGVETQWTIAGEWARYYRVTEVEK